MKKLFLYVFLGLLWCNAGFAEIVELKCPLNGTNLSALSWSGRTPFLNKTIELKVDTDKKTISNQKSEDETLILHGVLNTIKFEEDSLESALDILLTEEQKQKRAIEYYSYIAELSKQNDDGTASIYKYEGAVHLSDGKSLHIKIDYGASAVEKLTKRKLEFVFLCD